MKADEIRFLYKDRYKIIDYIEKYPNKIIILNIDEQDNIDLEELKRYNIITNNNFVLSLSSLKNYKLYKDNNLKFYFNYPITTYFDFKSLIELGVEYILVDSPLFQDIEFISSFNVKLRISPNISYYAFIPKKDGVCGSWIRPEDLEEYSKYIDTVEFENCDLKKEQALYRIYFEQKNWPGDLNYIITNLNYNCINRMIPPDFTKNRMNCKQKCMAGGHCKLCYRYLQLANPDLLNQINKI